MAPGSNLRGLYRPVRAEFDRLSGALIERVGRLTSPTTWVHGDFNLGNCLWDASADRLLSLVDWDQMQQDGEPGWELLKLIESIRRRARPSAYGDSLSGIISSGLTSEEDRLRPALHALSRLL